MLIFPFFLSVLNDRYLWKNWWWQDSKPGPLGHLSYLLTNWPPLHPRVTEKITVLVWLDFCQVATPSQNISLARESGHCGFRNCGISKKNISQGISIFGFLFINAWTFKSFFLSGCSNFFYLDYIIEPSLVSSKSLYNYSASHLKLNSLEYKLFFLNVFNDGP